MKKIFYIIVGSLTIIGLSALVLLLMGYRPLIPIGKVAPNFTAWSVVFNCLMFSLALWEGIGKEKERKRAERVQENAREKSEKDHEEIIRLKKEIEQLNNSKLGKEDSLSNREIQAIMDSP